MVSCQKGPNCHALRMAFRALLAGYHRIYLPEKVLITDGDRWEDDCLVENDLHVDGAWVAEEEPEPLEDEPGEYTGGHEHDDEPDESATETVKQCLEEGILHIYWWPGARWQARWVCNRDRETVVRGRDSTHILVATSTMTSQMSLQQKPWNSG